MADFSCAMRSKITVADLCKTNNIKNFQILKTLPIPSRTLCTDRVYIPLWTKHRVRPAA